MAFKNTDCKFVIKWALSKANLSSLNAAHHLITQLSEGSRRYPHKQEKNLIT